MNPTPLTKSDSEKMIDDLRLPPFRHHLEPSEAQAEPIVVHKGRLLALLHELAERRAEMNHREAGKVNPISTGHSIC